MANILFKTLLSVLCAGILVCGSYGFVADSQDQIPSPPPRYMARAFKIPPKYTKQEEHCLTEAIYYEAGNQSIAGKEAVAIVIVNRVNHGQYPNTICSVVSQAHMVSQKKICQFSYNCERKRPPIKKVWHESQEVAKRVLQNEWKCDILSKLGDAIYYHADYVSPKWKKRKVFVGKIENHLFYRDRAQL